MKKTNIPEIRKLLKKIRIWDKERRKNKLISLADISTFNQFEEKLKIKNINKNQIKEIWELYFKCVEQFCIKIEEIENSRNPNEPIIENLSSLSELLYLLDISFEIISSILLVNYNREEKNNKENFYLRFMLTVSIIQRKRDAIFAYINPFNVKLETQLPSRPENTKKVN